MESHSHSHSHRLTVSTEYSYFSPVGTIFIRDQMETIFIRDGDQAVPKAVKIARPRRAQSKSANFEAIPTSGVN